MADSSPRKRTRADAPRSGRRAIPGAVRDAVLLGAGYRCANPTCRHVLTLELHHIEWVRDGGGNHRDNLLALCPNCHSLHTHGHIPSTAVEAWKSLLVSLSSPHRASVDLLLVLADEEERIAALPAPSAGPPAPRFTGDSLPALAGLLTGGLLEIARRWSGVNMAGPGIPSFEVRLTNRGRRLIAAWKDGSPDAIRAALAVAPRAP